VDFLGNISMRLVGGLVTIGTLAAIYFFIIKPTTDTTSNAINSIAGPIQQAEKQAEQAQQQLQHNVNTGTPGSQVDLAQLQRLQRCVQKAGQDANKLTRCTQRYAP
jgi:hypothetical protein